MRITGHRIRRPIAVFLGILLAVPFGGAATPPSQQASPVQQPDDTSGLQVRSQGPENRPPQTTTNTTQPQETYPDSPGAVNSQLTGKTAQSPTTNASADQQQTGAPQPVGTAVAPYEKTTGVAASRPAGVVMAPAKQHRARSIVIRVSIIVGAAVAIGTVVELSNASHSRP